MKILKTTMLFLSLFLISKVLYSQTWQIYADSVQHYTVEKNREKIFEFNKKLKDELSKDSSGTLRYARVCDDVGLGLSQRKQYSLSENCFEESKKVREYIFGAGNLGCEDSYYNLAIIFSNQNKYEKSEVQWLKAKKALEMVGRNDTIYSLFCREFGIFYTSYGQLEKADAVLSEANEIMLKLYKEKNNSMYAAVSYSRGNLYEKKGNYDLAQSLYLEARQIFENLGKYDDAYANCLLKLGGLNRRVGNNNQAESLIKKSMTFYKSESLGYAEACNSLAIVYRNKGDFAKAEFQYKESLRILKIKLDVNSSRYANALNNLGNFYKEIGQFTNAESCLTQSLEIRRKIGEKNLDYANNCLNLARLYQQTDELGNVKQMYDTALKIIERSVGTRHPDYAIACAGLAAFYLASGENDKAENLYSEAKDIQDKILGNQNPDIAGTYNGLGIICEKNGNYDKAAEYYKYAKDTWSKVLGKQHPYYLAACANLANLYWNQGKIAKADLEFKEAFSSSSDNLDAVFQFTNEKEKIDFVKNIFGEDDKAYSFYYVNKAKSELPYELSLFHRNLILSSLQSLKQELAIINDSNLLKIFDEWISLKNQLSFLYTASLEERGKQNVATLEERTGELEKELVKTVGFKEKLVHWKDIQAKLETNAAAIEFASFRFNAGAASAIGKTDSIIYVALILRKDNELPVMIHLCSEKDLNHLFSEWETEEATGITKGLYTFKAHTNSGKNVKSNSLYDLIWRPMESELKKIDSIYYAPSGLLHTIAFAAIPIDEKTTLSDRYKLIQLASTTSVMDQKNSFINAKDQLALYGGIIYDEDKANLLDYAKHFDSSSKSRMTIPTDLTRGNWSYLSSTSDEVSNIEAMGKNAGYENIDIKDGSTASEESIKAMNGKASPAVLHTATHGFFYQKDKSEQSDTSISEKARVFLQSDDPLIRSALVFAGASISWSGKKLRSTDDGILTAFEVSNLWLPNTKLAVLSACQTALGDIQGNEGVYGLQRAFKIAGVKNLVMSLWKVPSKETAEFMEQFYKNMFAHQSISDAFYQAQKDLKEKYRNDPYKWAAWILVR